MKIAVMQPYLFPYIGYFQLINHIDRWVIFDDTQYISKGWVNRNRVLHPEADKEWQYITIPLKKHHRETLIKDVEINDICDWRANILGKLSAYRKKAPYYAQTIDFVSGCLEKEHIDLSGFLESSLRATCNYIDIPFEYSIFSKMSVDTTRASHPGSWALEIADALGADEYVNPYGGYEIFKEEEFRERGIRLNFLRPVLTPYVQRRGSFVPGLSIIDVLMWNHRDDVRKMLDDYDLMSFDELKGDAHD